MDPNIMKLLEDDEDDSMHSGADVDAFAAALNRDIEDQNASSSTSQQQSHPVTGALPQGSSSTSNQISSHLQDPKQEKDLDTEKKDEVVNPQQQVSASKTETGKHEPGSEKHEQQVASSQEHKQPLLKLKQEKTDHPPEEKPQQCGQQAGIEKTEQNIAPFREQDRTRPPENQYPTLLKTDSQQTPTSTSTLTPTAESESRNKQVAFGHLLPVITPFLDKDRAMQLQVLYQKLRKNEIHKDEFVRHMRNIVGDQMLRQAVHKIQVQQTKVQAAQNQQTVPQVQPQTSSQQQQQAKMQSVSVPQLKDSHPFSQLNQQGPRVPTDPPQVPITKIEIQSDSSFSNRESDSQKREKDHQSDSQGMHSNQVSSSSMGASNQERVPAIQGLNKNQQQHLHLPQQTSYPIYGSHMTNYHAHPYPGQSIGVSSSSLRPQLQDSQIRQVSLQQSMIPAQSGGMTQPTSSMNNQNNEIQNYGTEAKRLQGGSFPQMTSQSTMQQNSLAWQSSVGKDRKGTPIASLPYIKQEVLSQSQEQHTSHIAASSSATSFNSGKIDPGNPVPPVTSAISASMTSQLDSLIPVRSQVPPTTSSLGPGSNIKTPPKKTSIGQKKPLDASAAPSSLTNKKQKVSGSFHDQSIEQLNDVTTVSGVDLREEEEQLFSGPKEDSRASEATRRVVQEEEEKLILERVPFQKRMAKIISKFGIKNVNKDVERCLSLSLEERIRGLIGNLIRVSKQRVGIERSRHRTIITSDVRRQILLMNRKSKDDWEKKQAEEAEKLRKTNEADGSAGTDGEKDKDDGRAKPTKANKEEDEKMKTTAANVAARVAVGGDDMLSKWQLMAEQARQKREGGDSTSSAITQATSNKDNSTTTRNKPSSSTTTSGGGRNTRDGHDSDNRSPSTVTTSGLTRKFGRNMGVMTQTKIARSISVKDVIAVLEREPQMSKSTLVYRLYERMRSDAAARTSE
ncbi:hypothetical protein ACHQM5_020110 [Ranunculus cassubicifolius]